jgi:hypothetical protein
VPVSVVVSHLIRRYWLIFVSHRLWLTSGLISFSLPSPLETIGDYAFEPIFFLESITLNQPCQIWHGRDFLYSDVESISLYRARSSCSRPRTVCLDHFTLLFADRHRVSSHSCKRPVRCSISSFLSDSNVRCQYQPLRVRWSLMTIEQRTSDCPKSISHRLHPKSDSIVWEISHPFGTLWRVPELVIDSGMAKCHISSVNYIAWNWHGESNCETWYNGLISRYSQRLFCQSWIIPRWMRGYPLWNSVPILATHHLSQLRDDWIRHCRSFRDRDIMTLMFFIAHGVNSRMFAVLRRNAAIVIKQTSARIRLEWIHWASPRGFSFCFRSHFLDPSQQRPGHLFEALLCLCDLFHRL